MNVIFLLSLTYISAWSTCHNFC